jgi:hypothetical protein
MGHIHFFRNDDALEKSGNPGCCQGPEIEHDPPIGHFKFCLSISDSSESFNRFGFLL